MNDRTVPQRMGAVAMLLSLPALTCYLSVCLTRFDGELVLPSSRSELWRFVSAIPTPTLDAVLLYAGWIGSQVALHVALPARVVTTYRLNGWACFWATLAIAIGASLLGLPPAIGYEQFGPLMMVATLAAFAFALFVYLRWDGRSGIHAYVMGSTLNPRIGWFDLKFFCEGRLGLLLWVLLNASFAARQYELIGRVTIPMLLVNAFQFLYVADYFFHEEAVLTTWDIKHERFGWMLCWGCAVWVPFTFSIQAYFLVSHSHELSLVAAAAITALNMAGYAVFRASNLQKHRFRRDPARPVWGRPPEYIRTGAGPLLLTSGWWGVARHSNYLGDLMMGLAWCLPAGFTHPLPYFYILYFTILLVHRERRDHALCLQKYGRDWEDYCRKVRWRIVPGVY